ncbi:MAG: NUDIX hydrolase [Marmoricola sp.]
MRKRKGEHGIAVVPRVVFADQGVADVDLIASSQLAIEARVFCATVFVQDPAGDFVVVFSHRRNEWGPPGGWREADETPLETAIRETREETGLVLRPETVVPIGYERYRNRSGGHLWHPTGDLMQVFGARLDSVRLALIDDDDGIGGVEWVRFTQFRERCGGVVLVAVG